MYVLGGSDKGLALRTEWAAVIGLGIALNPSYTVSTLFISFNWLKIYSSGNMYKNYTE